MNPLLKQYAVIVDFLGASLGRDYEIVLHDLQAESPGIVAISNGHVSGRSVGAPLTNKALRFLQEREYEKHTYKAGYPGLSDNGTELQCSTMFIQDDTGTPIGMLCINFDPSRCLQAVNSLLSVCNLNVASLPFVQEENAMVETFVTNIPDAVQHAIVEVTGHIHLPSRRLTMEEKVQIVEALQKNGLFYLKGAVSEVATLLNSSEATIYRYLSKLKG